MAVSKYLTCGDALGIAPPLTLNGPDVYPDRPGAFSGTGRSGGTGLCCPLGEKRYCRGSVGLP